ncbi:hypothetical protein BH18ACI5_BH18ACI5_03910 [soil metagenome]
MPPIQLLLTRRLLLAKQLLTETTLPVTDIGFASGFSSLRRFNDAFTGRYGMPPTRLRKKATDDSAAVLGGQTSTLQLSYRPPYDWRGVLAFLGARALRGVAHVTDDSYARTVRLGDATGWIRVTQAKSKHALMVEFTHTLTPVLPALLTRVRSLFDVDARPDLIAQHLGRDARLRSAVKANPGLRVPGAFNGFEMGVRAILGQQVTVRAATTIAGRYVETFGMPIATPLGELSRLTPAAARVAAVSVDDLARHGIVAARARSIVALARAQRSGGLRLDCGAHHDPEDSIRRRRSYPELGPGPPSRKKTSSFATILEGSARKRRRRCHRSGGRGAATPSCTCGGWKGRRIDSRAGDMQTCIIPPPDGASALEVHAAQPAVDHTGIDSVLTCREYIAAGFGDRHEAAEDLGDGFLPRGESQQRW